MKRVLPLSVVLLATFSPPALAAWEYRTSIDSMTGKESAFATVNSTNSVDIRFPYGKVTARLLLRSHARHGRDVMLMVSDGQMLCRSYGDPCKLLVRFDDAPPQPYSASGPEDGSSTTAFIAGFDRFVSAAKRAKQVKIEAPFYRAGGQIFVFDIAGLDANKIGVIEVEKKAPANDTNNALPPQKVAGKQSPPQKLVIDEPSPPKDIDPAGLARERTCFACHAIAQKIVGPAYQAVASKYRDQPGAVQQLADKIQRGGSGVWGRIPMPPNRVTPDEAAMLAEWVLQQ